MLDLVPRSEQRSPKPLSRTDSMRRSIFWVLNRKDAQAASDIPWPSSMFAFRVDQPTVVPVPALLQSIGPAWFGGNWDCETAGGFDLPPQASNIEGR